MFTRLRQDANDSELEEKATDLEKEVEDLRNKHDVIGIGVPVATPTISVEEQDVKELAGLKEVLSDEVEGLVEQLPSTKMLEAEIKQKEEALAEAKEFEKKHLENVPTDTAREIGVYQVKLAALKNEKEKVMKVNAKLSALVKTLIMKVEALSKSSESQKQTETELQGTFQCDSRLQPEGECELIMEKSDGEERPDLVKNVLLREINLGGGKDHCTDLLKATCALFNSGGGKIEVKISDHSDLSEEGTFLTKLDYFWQQYENKLESVAEPSHYVELIDCTRKDDVLYLSIKAPDHLTTLVRTLFLTGDVRLYEATNDRTSKCLKEPPQLKVPLQKLPSLPENFVSGQKLKFHESRQMQFKHYKSSSHATVKKLEKNKYDIQKLISGFANVIGGIILIGISNKSIVEGQSLDNGENSSEKVEQLVKSFIEGMKWCCIPSKKIHWDVKFIPLEDKKNCFVIAICVAGMRGAVFAKSPKSYVVRQGNIDLLTFDEWKQGMIFGKHMLQLQMEREGCPVNPNLPEEAKSDIEPAQQRCTFSCDVTLTEALITAFLLSLGSPDFNETL